MPARFDGPIRPLTRLVPRLALACFALCAAACGSEAPTGAVEQANITPPGPGDPPMGYRWDPRWDRVLPDAAFADPARRPTGPPAMVLFNGVRHYFYAAADGKLAHYAEGSGIVVLTDQRLVGAPAAVVANGNIEIFYRTPDTANFTVDHVRWNGVYQTVTSGRYSETIGYAATTTPGASTVTVQVPIYILGRWLYQSVTRVDVYYNAAVGGLTSVHRVGNGAWTAPQPFDGVVAVSAPAAVSWGPGRLDLFWRAADKTIQHKWFDGASWSAGGEPMMTNAESAPAVSSWGALRLDIFAVRSDGKLQHVWYYGSGWKGPAAEPAADCVATVSSPGEHDSAAPTVFGTTPVHIDLAIWGTDGNIWHDSYGYGALDSVASTPTCSCGAKDGVCCDGSTCGPGLACAAGGVCATCGAAGQIRCPGAACGSGLACNDAGLCATPPPPPPSKWDLLYDNVLSTICVGCHRSGTNQFLVRDDKHASFVKLRGYVSHERPGELIVKAGDADGSYIYQKVTGAPGIIDERMPRDSGGAWLDATQLELMRDWIASGATE